MVYIKNMHDFTFSKGCCILNDELSYLTEQLFNIIKNNSKIVTFGMEIINKFNKEIDNYYYHFFNDSDFYSAIKKNPEYIVFNSVKSLNNDENINKIIALVECGYKIVLINSPFNIDNFHPNVQKNIYHLNKCQL